MIGTGIGGSDCGENILPINFYKKEVKKVKKSVDYRKLPYFETKVVKVKKGGYRLGDTFKCPKCGELFIPIPRTDKPKGNWVNGENLDKIKFPVPCRFGNRGKLGLLLNGVDDNGNNIFELHQITEQISKHNCTRMNHQKDLKALIKQYNIHILKGKIILFEEEAND